MKIKGSAFDKSSYRTGAAAKTPRFGFSLVELLVVISVIALLLSLFMPALGRARSSAMRLKCAHNLKQVHLALLMYQHGNEDRYPCAQDPFPGGYWLWMGIWGYFVEPYLGINITPDRPSVMVCPQDPKQQGSFSYAYSMAFYHSPAQIDTMNRVEDTYLPARVQPSIPQRSSAVAKPSRKILVGEWFSNHQPTSFDQGWWGWDGRRNYLFVDGQVNYLEAKEIRPARDGLADAHLTVHGINGMDWPL